MPQAPLDYVRLLLIKLSNRQSKGHRFNPKRCDEAGARVVVGEKAMREKTCFRATLG